VDASLNRLGTDYIDLYWVHVWDAFTPVEEVIHALDDLVRSGKVLYVGISDTPRGSSPEPSRSPKNAGSRHSVRYRCPTAWSSGPSNASFYRWHAPSTSPSPAGRPLGGGLLTGRYGSDRERPADSRLAGIGGAHERHTLSERNLAIADTLNVVARARGASTSQVAIAWVRAQQRRAVTIPILGVRTQAQLADNLGATDINLEPIELDQLDEASTVSPGFPGDFDGAKLAYGNTLDLINDHRRTVNPLI
jgi:aryl-alcohol dehydrogenase-like predicted oxidoreductase